MTSKIQVKVTNSDAFNEEGFIKTIVNLTRVHPAYTVEQMLTEVRIPRMMIMAELAFGGNK